FMDIQLPNGAMEGVLVYALEDFEEWNLPWTVQGGDVRDLRRGMNVLMDRSAEQRFGTFSIGDYREISWTRRYQIIGTTSGAVSFTTAPIMFMDYRNAQDTVEFLRGRTSYILVKIAPWADPERIVEEIRQRLPYNDVHTKDEWARKSRIYWVVST